MSPCPSAKSTSARQPRRCASCAARPSARREEGGPGLTTWEKDFVEGVTGRLENYGSAFRDPAKGRLEEALSQRQAQVARVIDKKSRKGKGAGRGWTERGQQAEPPRSTFKRQTPMRSKAKPGWTPRVRDINDDLAPQNRRAAARSAPPEGHTRRQGALRRRRLAALRSLRSLRQMPWLIEPDGAAS